MIKKFVISAALTLSLVATGAMAEEDGGEEEVLEDYVEDLDFSFEGPFGTFDQNQLQRGLQVFTAVCSACHGTKFLYFRNLSDEGGPNLPEDQTRAYAEQYEVYDPELRDYRQATPADRFPENTAAGAPDLTLMAKARAGFEGPYGLGLNQLFRGMGGAEYIAAFLKGYTGEEEEVAGSVLYQNTAFPGGWTSMPPPLWGEDVEFADGSPNTIAAESEDVAAYLMWTAEPKLMARKQAGFLGVFFLTILTVLLYLTNKRIWAPIKGKKKA